MDTVTAVPFVWPVEVRREVEAGNLALHGWHYVIKEGEIRILDLPQGQFVPVASEATNSGTGPYQLYVENDWQIFSF